MRLALHLVLVPLPEEARAARRGQVQPLPDVAVQRHVVARRDVVGRALVVLRPQRTSAAGIASNASTGQLQADRKNP